MTSQRMRNEYPETVVGGVDSRWNVTGTRPVCDYGITKKVKFWAGGDLSQFPAGFVDLRFHPVVVPWARAMASVFLSHRYSFDETAGGSVSCRAITGGSRKTSLHAHAVVFDINPSRNRYRRHFGPIQWGKQTDMSRAMIADTKAIRTVDSAKVTSWGGDWTNIKDPMHFEASKPLRVVLERGINTATVAGWDEYLAWVNDPGGTHPIPGLGDEKMLPIRYGDGFATPPPDAVVSGNRRHRREDVKALQERVGVDPDGFYGSGTAGAVATVLANGSDGRFVGGVEWNDIEKKWQGSGDHDHPHTHPVTGVAE